MINTNYGGNAISSDYIAAISQPMVSYDARLYDNGAVLDCDIMRMELTLGSCADPLGDSDFAIGEVYATGMEATLYGLQGSLVGKELDVCIGVGIAGGTYEYVQVATVIVTSAKTRAGKTTVQAAGKLAYAATNCLLGVDGVLTPAQAASAISSASGLSVSIGQFASTSTTVTVESSMTCRSALSALAKRLGGYACETNTGGVIVAPFDGTATCTLDPDTSTRLPDVEEDDYEVDGITVVSADGQYEFGTGRVEISDSGATSDTASVTWANVQGYSFRPGSANTAVLDPRITPFDVLSVEHGTDTVLVPARGIAATYDGGYFGTFSAVGLTGAGEEALLKGPVTEQVDLALQAAEQALEVAEAVDQHFWTDTGGAHVTGPDTQDEFLAAQAAGFPDYDPTTKPYHNILLNSLGILLGTALNNLVSITRSAIAFFDGQGNNAANIVASFGANGAQIGKSNAAHSVIDADGQRFYGGNDGAVQLANIGYGEGAAASGTAVAPYYTFGTRDASATIGNYSVAEGYNVEASGYSSHAEGSETHATEIWSHAEGDKTTASGPSSHAEGFETTASDYRSHAEGSQTTASGFISHAEGDDTIASGQCSHSEGSDTIASGAYSHAQNEGTIAAKRAQTVMGTYNVEDTSSTTTHPDGIASYGTHALIIGNGSSDRNRSNAFTIDWDGSGEFAGDVSAVDGTFTGDISADGGLTLGTPLPIASGGTGEATASDAWTALGGGSIGKKNSLAASDIPLATTSAQGAITADEKKKLNAISIGSQSNIQQNADTNGKRWRLRLSNADPANLAADVSTDGGSTWSSGTSTGSVYFSKTDHTHAAGDITSGTLPIARGGTGESTAAAAWTALGGGSIGKKSSLAASDIPTLTMSKISDAGTLAKKSSGSVNVAASMTTETYTKTYTVAASGTATIEITGVSKTNYTFAGLRRLTTGVQGSVGVVGWYLDGSTLNVYLKNFSTSQQASKTCSAVVCWVQTASLSRSVTFS